MSFRSHNTNVQPGADEAASPRNNPLNYLLFLGHKGYSWPSGPTHTTSVTDTPLVPRSFMMPDERMLISWSLDYGAVRIFLEDAQNCFVLSASPSDSVIAFPVRTTPGPAAVGLRNIQSQLADLKNLKKGWAEGVQSASQWGTGYGEPLSSEGLKWLAHQFTAYYAFDLPRPYLYPTPEGGVQAEWTLGPNETSLEIDLTAHTAEWHCLNWQTKHSSHRSLNLGSADAWKWLDSQLRKQDSLRSE